MFWRAFFLGFAGGIVVLLIAMAMGRAAKDEEEAGST